MKTTITIVFIAFSLTLKAQWSSPDSNSRISYNAGNVGIGTASPAFKFHIRGGNSNSDFMTLGNNMTGNFALTDAGGGAYGLFAGVSNTGRSWLQAGRYDTNIAYDLVVQASGGNFGIGILNPRFKLDVAGQIATGFSFLENTVDPDNNYTRTNFGSNVYWEPVANRWEVSPIGNNDFSSIIHPNADGFAFITAPTIANAPRTLTHGEFMGFERMRITASGNVGIGTSAPGFKLHIRGVNPNSDLMTLGSTATGNFALTDAAGGAYGLFGGISDTGRAWLQAGRYDSNIAYDFVLQASGGNVLIGKTSQANNVYRLDVNGSIRSNEVVVNVTGADFVFDKAYDLRPLEEVEKFIIDNKHLPDIQSAHEMEENGLEVGNMEMKLLQKIEELTLYMIAMKKEIEELKAQNENLKR